MITFLDISDCEQLQNMTFLRNTVYKTYVLLY